MKLLWCVLVLPLAAQVAEKANERYKTPEGRAGMIRTLTDSGRDARQKPRELVAELNIKPGMTVADLGDGSGIHVALLE